MTGVTVLSPSPDGEAWHSHLFVSRVPGQGASFLRRSHRQAKPGHRSSLATSDADLHLRLGSGDGVAAYNSGMHDVVVYSRKGCHLCEVVKEMLARVEGQADFCWREVDIDDDEELRQKYDVEVPVVFIDGRKAFKYHMEEREFLRVLRRRELKQQ